MSESLDSVWRTGITDELSQNSSPNIIANEIIRGSTTNSLTVTWRKGVSAVYVDSNASVVCSTTTRAA